MQEIRRRKVAGIGLRIAAPKFVRVLALVLLACGLAAVAISYWRLRGHTEFRLRPGQAQLSTKVVGDIRNLEHREMKGDRLWVVLTADHDLQFSDGHHELENVHLEVYPEKGDQPDKISSQRTLTNEDNTQFLFNGNVQIETRDHLAVKSETVEYDVKTEVGNVTTPVSFERENVSGRADNASLNGKSKKLDLKGNVEITVKPEADAQQQPTPAGVPKINLRGLPVTVKSAQADFDQNALQITFGGGAVAEQGRDVMSGDTLTGNLSEQKRVKYIAARGSAYLRSLNEGHAAEVFADQIDFYFDENQKLQSAHALRNVRANTVGADSDAQIVTQQGAVDLDFAVQDDHSVLKQLNAGERPIVTLSAPKSKAADPKAANKRLTADAIRLYWHPSGRDLERAEANGNVELLVEPAQPNPAADRKTLYSTVMQCRFYEAGNLAQTFTASGNAKAVVEPLQQTEKRATRTLTSQEMVAQFVRETQDIERFDATGDAHFEERERTLASQKMTALFSPNGGALERVDATGDPKYKEQDRNGQAAAMSYTTGDGFVRLRGGEPVVWDSRARLKATEIDADTISKVSNARGKVLTTYYSQEQTGRAAPFKNVKSPVFIASAAAEFQHDAGIGIYTGNARAWQDDNFVKADRIVLYHERKRMEAEGSVQSALYNARRKEANGERAVVPVFATSRSMSYSDSERLVHYEGDVDIRQGTERITSGVADVYLQKDSYEVEHTVAQRNVVVTQPGRRGNGDWAQYTAEDEKVVLTGNPARVEDAEKGTSESRRMIVYLRDNRVISDGGENAQQQSTGRVHTTHKIRKP
ncbi:MAG TPA: LPS export ABC transporter periplasmic protein LptC [Pyrinomonadaceae bacterium]|jgi:LPS export ABC transporter protein LptC/lipopolysaccharide transport protein LptA|nr:LPS export ABC transporter periplasmic protein LptC [Pyrinomonadaceae bacterium]